MTSGQAPASPSPSRSGHKLLKEAANRWDGSKPAVK
jgi:hypothetical protein